MKFYDRDDVMTDLIAVDTKNKEHIIGEVKRNKNKISIPVVEQKTKKILAHHKKWNIQFIGLSLEDLVKNL